MEKGEWRMENEKETGWASVELVWRVVEVI
jgi:hypothetical protein